MHFAIRSLFVFPNQPTKMQLLGIGSRVQHPDFGVGVVLNQKTKGHLITYVNYGVDETPYGTELEILESIEPDGNHMSMRDVEIALNSILEKWADVSEIVPLGDKWRNGKVILRPGVVGLQEKEWPNNSFFHKIVMLRDRLRVLEQRVNASSMEDEEKMNIKQYITRCYGSLTSFNLLVQRKEPLLSGRQKKFRRRMNFSRLSFVE